MNVAGRIVTPSRRRPLVATVMIVLAVHVVGRVGAFCSPIHADSYAYGTIGYRLAQGEVFYRDVSDVKPPGLYLFYALWYLFLPPGREAMIPADTLCALAGYWAVYALGRELYGPSVGMVLSVTAALAANYFAMMDFATDGFGLAEGFMVFPVVMAVRNYRRAVKSGAVGRFAWCGGWIGLALCIKQTALPLAAAMALHWTGWAVCMRRDRRRWLAGAAGMLVGGLAAVSPFVTLVLVQGTWRRAVELLGPRAAGMLSRGTGWPTQWDDVLPLWVPLAWCAVGVAWCAEDGWRRRSSGRSPSGSHQPSAVSRQPSCPRKRGHATQASLRPCVPSSLRPFVPASAADLSLLLTWLAAEAVMLAYLPLRAFHYYVLSSLPVVVLSGVFGARLLGWAGGRPPGVRVACASTAAVLSIAFGRPIVDTMVPAAIARCRSYDAAADRAYFDRILSLKINTFGAPPPTTEPGS